MASVLPFNGLLPQPQKIAQVAAVPYDVVNSEEAAELAKGNPLSFLRVSRPEIEMDPGVDLHCDAVYEKAAANFKRLCATAPLEIDPEKHLYLYRLQMGSHIQTGVVGAVSAAEYNADIIKKHEKTRKDKEDDRTRHMMELRSHTGPALLTYRDSDAINAMTDKITAAEPLCQFTAPDGIIHTLWRIDPASSVALSKLFEAVPCLYIADGHHRSAAAARTAAECAPQNPHHTGNEDYNFFLAVTFPQSQLRILAYNRAVKSLNGLTPEQFLQKVQEKFSIEKTSVREPGKSGEFCVYLDKQWYLARPKFDASERGVIGCLDVSVLQDDILTPLLGIDDPRTSTDIDFIGGIRGTAELVKLVDSGKFAIAFSMYPTTLTQLMDIADADAIMPPKSTWFEPKLRDGIVCHNF
ncbi:MAG: DUF1015 family protein [Victivallaceae bacterium]|nr:DUF1015 family protein [Victivallaceae bacterium]MDD3703505.1 DUF1015 family protein [Victivallaceae bacterium]MDD4317120.1 DUF1015 family protein [Victivallaceae bacterium]MDD5662954.1 DUF1015 family protein [Victivallaceae bacterium]NLK82736.1 DUF1015 domain-containing protein [Lentisphaerota bacterium]